MPSSCTVANCSELSVAEVIALRFSAAAANDDFAAVGTSALPFPVGGETVRTPIHSAGF